MNVEETLNNLVAIDSVSSRSNAEIISYLASRCEAAGFSITRFPHPDENGIEKTNLVALAGAEFSDNLAIQLALVGHTDTIPYNPTWTKALQLTPRQRNPFP